MRCSEKKEDSVSVEQEGPNLRLMEPNLNSPPQTRTPSLFGLGNRKDNYGSKTMKKCGELFTWENLGKLWHLEIVSKFYKGDHQVNFTCGYNFLSLANLGQFTDDY